LSTSTERNRSKDRATPPGAPTPNNRKPNMITHQEYLNILEAMSPIPAENIRKLFEMATKGEDDADELAEACLDLGVPIPPKFFGEYSEPRVQKDATLSPVELAIKYDRAGEHFLFPARQWRIAVSDKKTLQGYWAWVSVCAVHRCKVHQPIAVVTPRCTASVPVVVPPVTTASDQELHIPARPGQYSLRPTQGSK